MINFIYVKQIDALPQGVERVEIGNWTKTREVNEIDGGEKKLNSQYLDNIKNINFDENLNELEIFTSLYTSSNSMRDVSRVSSVEYEGDKSIIKGNKILRTIARTSQPLYSFDYNTMKSWVGSNTNANWRDGLLGTNIITWPCYVEVIEDKNTQAPVEWRMLEGEFKLNQNQLELISSKKVQPIIGIESDEGCNFVLPFCDLINIFINEEITDLNYRAVNDAYKFKIGDSNGIIGNYQYVDISGNEKYCDEETHNDISQHTYNKHIDCNILKSSTNNNYYKMVGDISQYIKKSNESYKISLLIGQIGRSGENAINYNGGTSKITLFLVENPQFDVNIKPYIVKDDNEKTYISSDYKFSYNEKVLFDVEIVNESSSYDYSNLDIQIDLIKEVKTGGKKISDVIKLSKIYATYNGNSITDNMSLYLNDESEPYSVSQLSNLKKGDKLTISSSDFVYNVTEYNALNERVSYDYTLQFNYINNYTFYKYINTNSLQVKPIGGRLTVTVKGREDDYFYLKLVGENNFSNIKIKSNEPYTICNLDYEKEYKLSLINSCSYKPVNSQNFTLKNSAGYNTKSIIINTNEKLNNYFTQRKIDKIIINR